MLLHFRFNDEIKDEVLAYLLKSSTYYCVTREVAHRVHYHTFAELDCKEDALKKRLQGFCKAKGLQTAKGKANSYYGGVKECTDKSYLCKDGNMIAGTLNPEEFELLYNEGKEKYNKDAEIPLLANIQDSKPVQVITVKTRTLRDRFVRYLSDELHWEPEKFSVEAYEEGKKLVTKEAVRFTSGAFTTNEGIRLCRYALYKFADIELQWALESRFTQDVIKYL